MKIWFLVSLCLGIGTFNLSLADIVALPHQISFQEDINQWNSALVDKVLENAQLKKTGLMECGELKELKGVVLCAATKKAYMNRALSRASIFSEGSTGIQKGTVTSTGSAVYSNIVANALGHDIPSSELLKFWNQLNLDCQQKQLCPTPEEEEFFNAIVLPISQKESPFAVISYSIDTEWYVTLSHEMMHAQYFLNKSYQETVDKFWNEKVTEEDRKSIRQVLGSQYNQNDEFVIRNEFQAYLLQAQGLQYTLGKYVPKYRELLIQSLREAGATPLGL